MTAEPAARRAGRRDGAGGRAPSEWDHLCAQVKGVRPDVLDPTLELALEIAREGREGRRVGTLFTVGRADAVLERSRPLILNPLAGHSPAATHIGDPSLRGTIKELAQLDGAFVVDDNGIVVAACRYLEASVKGVTLPLGLGSRHLAAASISQELSIVAIVVSESAVVRMFADGRIAAEILPELWLLERHERRTGRRDRAPKRGRAVNLMAVVRG